jgi:gluconolactonase
VSVEVVATGLDMPEGPCLDSDGQLYVVEIGAGFVTRIDVDSGVIDRRFTTGGGPNGCALGPDGNLYISNNGGVEKGTEFVDVTGHHGPGRVERCSTADGSVSEVCRASRERTLSGPNDVAFDNEGYMWFTDPGHGDLKEARGIIYRSSTDGKDVREVASGYQYPNGLAFTANGDTLLIAETGSRTIWKHEVKDAGLGERQLFAKLPRGAGPDGFCLDSAGNVIVAGAFAGQVFVFDSDGVLVEQFEVEDKLVTNVAFGGSTFKQLFITLTHLGQLVTRDWPVPGLALPGILQM